MESFIYFKNIAEKHPNDVKQRNAIERQSLLVNKISLILLDKFVSFHKKNTSNDFDFVLSENTTKIDLKKFAKEQHTAIKEILNTLNKAFHQITINFSDLSALKNKEKHQNKSKKQKNISTNEANISGNLTK